MRTRLIRAAAWGCLTVAAIAGTFAARAADFETFRDVTYVERDGQDIKADVYVPNGSGPFPGVLLVHGGAGRAGSKEPFGRFATRLTAAGFTSVSINYRLAPDHKFPAQIEDCKSAVRWMRNNAAKYKIDPERIGAVGYSAGGHLVTLLGTSDASCGLEGPDADGTSTRLQCVVAGGAPCDFRRLPLNSQGMAYWLGGTRAEKPEAYELASPVKFVTKDDPPMLFFHGEEDRLVPIISPKAAIAALTAAGVSARLYTVPGAGHPQAVADDKAWEEIVRFFGEQLKK